VAGGVPGRALCQEPPAGKLVWSDEFNGDQIDHDVWTYDVGGQGFGNGQLEYNTARRENSYLENGRLVIEARRENYKGNSFTSARMLTQGRFAFRYGTLEARIKVPDTANGIWPAFWMLGNNFPAIEWPRCGEADILEIGGKEGIAQGLQHRRINCALHFADLNERKTSRVAWLTAPADLHQDFHRYKISWTPRDMKFFLDGKQFGAWDISGAAYRKFHQPCFPILNVAVGSWTSSYTAIDTPNKVTAPFPAKMFVDWIRLYANPHTQIFFGKDSQESGNFGVFTETHSVRESLKFAAAAAPGFPYGDGAALFTWNNMTPSAKPTVASDEKHCWSYDVTAGDWFGMGVFVPKYRNMKNYAKGILHFDIRTTSPTHIKVGIKSSRSGEAWIPLGDETSEIGFARDGKWHTVALPLQRFAKTDFLTIHQMFMIAGDAPSSSCKLSIDNIWWEPAATGR